MKEKKTNKNRSSPAKIWTCSPTSSSAKSCTGTYDHWKNNVLTFIVLKYFSLPFTLFEPCGAVYHEFKDTFEENSLNEYFKTISHYFRVHRSRWTHWSFFFAALAEVQVVVLSVLNLLWQGFPASCPIGHCCVCSPLLFASEILCDSPTHKLTLETQGHVAAARKRSHQ